MLNVLPREHCWSHAEQNQWKLHINAMCLSRVCIASPVIRVDESMKLGHAVADVGLQFERYHRLCTSL